MNILIVSDQEMLSCSYKMYATVLGEVNFISVSDSLNDDQIIDAVLIDVQNRSKDFVKKNIDIYAHYPVFLINSERKRHNFLKDGDVLGEFLNSLSIYKITQSIKSTLDIINACGECSNSAKAKIQINIKEMAILESLMQGWSDKEIARNFSLSISTVKYYIRKLYIKLNVKNRTQAALIAREIIV